VSAADGMHLSKDEAAALALLLVARKIEDVEWWLDWEDLPNLDEYSIGLVADQMASVSQSVRATLSVFETQAEVDSRDVLSRATA
jgi:hypothetical protein